jgi:hypothetical protein
MVFFQTKIPIWVIFYELAMEEVGKFCVHLVYFTDIWCNLWPFGILLVVWYIFPSFGKY